MVSTFRRTLRSISYPEGMMGYLWAKQVRLTEFGGHVLRVSERLKQTCRAKAEALGRTLTYLASAAESKEEVAREIAVGEAIEGGLICVLSCAEPCRIFEVRRNRDTRRLELVSRIRKSLLGRTIVFRGCKDGSKRKTKGLTLTLRQAGSCVRRKP